MAEKERLFLINSVKEDKLRQVFAHVASPQLWVSAGVDSKGTRDVTAPEGPWGLLCPTFPTVTFRVAPVANRREFVFYRSFT